MSSIRIGIDIGGKHVEMGLVDDSRNIIVRKYLYHDEKTFNIQKMFNEINDFIEENEDRAESIGIGIPGFATDTLIHYTCNLPIKELEITDYIKTKLPIYISNDASCATIAEYELVDRKMFSNYILVTVGTGIGSGIIINGNLYTGSTGTAGEIGHMIIEKDGIECTCGRNGCFERYASISALLKMLDTDNVKEVFYLIDKNPVIQNVFEKYLDNLAEGLANIINIFDPEMLVIGGGLSEHGDNFLYKLKPKIVSRLYNQYTYDLNLKVATLKNDAGLIGASMLQDYLN